MRRMIAIIITILIVLTCTVALGLARAADKPVPQAVDVPERISPYAGGDASQVASEIAYMRGHIATPEPIPPAPSVIRRRAPMRPRPRATRSTRTYASSAAEVRAIIAVEFKAAGWTGAELEAGLTLAYRESSFRPTARNGDCLGLWQLSSAMCTGFDWRDPRANTRRAIRYIRGRYGCPCKALAHSDAHRWY